MVLTTICLFWCGAKTSTNRDKVIKDQRKMGVGG